MLKNHLKIALRNWGRQKVYSLINVVGLAIGLSCCFLVFLYVWNEWHHDRYHTNAEQIYRLALNAHSGNETTHAAVSPLPFAPKLREDFPEVLNHVRFIKTSGVFRNDSRRFREENVLFADASFFDIFSLPLSQGESSTALREPFTAVLTKETAIKYFGTIDVVGRTLIIDNENTYSITGVVDDLQPSHLDFDILLSLESWKILNVSKTENWTWFNFYTYLLLPPDYNPALLEAKLPEFFERHAGDTSLEEGVSYTFVLEPLGDIYLRSNRVAEIGRSGSLTTIYLVSIVAIFILLLACVNFINLTTARSVRRAREVGIRKVVGAQPRQLIQQFLSESVLIVLVATGFSFLLTWECLPLFSILTGKSLSLHLLFSWPALIFAFGMIVIVGVIAGVYPAFFLSGFRPLSVLRGKFTSTSQGRTLRKGLVVFQFSISIGLIIAMLILHHQLDYLQTRELGFDKDKILLLNMGSEAKVRARFETIKEALSGLPSVLSATASDFTPGGPVGAITANVELRPGENHKFLTAYCLVDYDFLATYGIDVIAGRNFSRNFATDSTEAFVINRAAVRKGGWLSPEEALGKRVEQWGRSGTIIGVTENFNFKSLHHSVEPLFMHIRPDWFKYISLRINTANIRKTLTEIEIIWNRTVPATPFDFAFADDRIERQYESEARLGRLMRYLSGLAIFIACLGLFGLSAFSAEQRTREIGIRKVLGASTASILGLLSDEFVRLILIANAISWPVAWFIMNIWLRDFAYRVDLVSTGWWIFVLAGTGAFTIAILTISTQAVKAALLNPVDTLKYE